MSKKLAINAKIENLKKQLKKIETEERIEVAELVINLYRNNQINDANLKSELAKILGDNNAEKNKHIKQNIPEDEIAE